MDRHFALRLAWAAMALPLSFVFLTTSLGTWPAVLNNNVPRLLLIAYVILAPALSLTAAGFSRVQVLAGAFATFSLQLLALGLLNGWWS